MRSGIIRTKFGWSVHCNHSNEPGWPQTLLNYPIRSSCDMEGHRGYRRILGKLFVKDEGLDQVFSLTYEEKYAVNRFKRTIQRRPDGT